MRQLLVATSNQGKIAEFRHALKELKWQIATPQELNLENLVVAETGDTFAKNAIIKAKAFAQKSGLITLADDSGLVVKALDDRPGVYSARYGSTDIDRNQKILQEMTGKTNRQAYFEAAIAIHNPANNKTLTFTGRTTGEILTKPIGTNGFGYDPIFYSHDLKQSFGEATIKKKNRVSHRGHALQKAVAALKHWS